MAFGQVEPRPLLASTEGEAEQEVELSLLQVREGPGHVFGILASGEDGSPTSQPSVIASHSTLAERQDRLPVRRIVRRVYLVYCMTCMVITGTLLAVTVWEGLAPEKEANWWRRRLLPWEEACEVFVGTALCTETLVPLFLYGTRGLMRDKWRLLDACVAGLTLVCGIFLLFRRAIRQADNVVEDIDMPILGLRFALQPVRMISTASLVVRARRLQQATETATEEPTLIDPRRPCRELESVMSSELAAELREMLPSYLKFQEWQLAYSPRIHGTSLNTFYRRQTGPNILVVRDAHGGLFGGFATEPWRPQAGAYGTADAFVFTAHEAPSITPPPLRFGDGCREVVQGPESPAVRPQLEVFWAVPQRGRVIQWSDSKMLGLGHAVVVCEDFLRGTTASDEAFGSGPLSPAGSEFIIRDFECWRVGCDPEDTIV